jgi:hypothetical protein
MNGTLVDRIAEAVLYEGYVLYPYQPSVKNRRRPATSLSRLRHAAAGSRPRP